MLVATIVEYGVFLPVEPPGPAMSIDSGHHLIRMEGVERPILFFKVNLTGLVASPEPLDDILVIDANQPTIRDEEILSFTRSLPTRPLVFIRGMQGPSADATCTGPTSRERAAAAVATVLVVAGWEESPLILVDIDGHRLDVVMQRSAERWLADVRSRN